MIEYFLLAFIPFAILPALALALAGTEKPAKAVCGVAAISVVVWFFGLCAFFLPAPLLLLQAFLTLMVGAVCLNMDVRPRTLVLLSVAITVVTFGLEIRPAYTENQKVRELQAEFPLISLADRLAYESDAKHPQNTLLNAPAQNSQTVESQLQTWEGRHERQEQSDFPYFLRRLHNESYETFAKANGFGSTRIIFTRVSIALYRRPPPPQDAGPVSLSPPSYSLPESAVGDEHPKDKPSSSTALRLTYTSGIAQFLDPERMGYAKDVSQVAGFQSHGFRPGPKLQPATAAPDGWHVARLELVSLLKHETPVAYVSEYLPRMDELRQAPTRPLDEFERLSLEKLWSQEDLVIDEQPHRIRMLGAVRAAKQCLNCHSVQRGQLLGAFSYELVPVRPLPAIQKPDEPRPRA